MKWNEVTWYSKVGAVILFLVVVPALSFYIGTQYQLTVTANTILVPPLTKPQQNNGDVTPEPMTIRGSYVTCLPRHDNFSPDVCVPGIQADDGTYYAVDFYLMSQMRQPLVQGEYFTASGVFTPIEILSSDIWLGSIAKGIFSITNMHDSEEE